ncbi:MAG: HNH endonuclease [Thaumarchaeota archaeon]|nr:HNH endonuclease [Nitrososphaerota archaeon]
MGWYPLPPKERFISKIDFQSSKNGCWVWIGHIDRKGTQYEYGRFWFNNTNAMAHRFSYEVLAGNKIPEGYQIDHLCKNQLCVNPKHLQAVPQQENSNRSNNPMAINSRRTECIRGHELSGVNLYIAKDGHRKCKKCIALRTAQFRKTGKYALPKRNCYLTG